MPAISHCSKRDYCHLAVLLLIWLAAIFLANAFGEFPLNDDWNYTRSVQMLLESHKVTPTLWTFTHVFIGYAVCSVSGFSFEVLHWLQRTFGAITIVLTYLLARQAVDKHWPALLLAACMAFNPLFFELCNTFMTDVPYFMFCCGAIFLYSRMIGGQERAAWRQQSWAALATAAAFLTRQTAGLIAFSYFLTSLLSRRISKANVTDGAVPLLSASIVCGLFLYAYYTLQSYYNGEPYSTNSASMRMYFAIRFAHGPFQAVLKVIIETVIAYVYIGLFLLPLLVVAAKPYAQSLEKKHRFLFIALTAELGLLTFVGFVFGGALMPLGENVLMDAGLGPILVHSISWPTAPAPFWLLLTFLGALGAAMIITMMFLTVMQLFNARKTGPLVSVDRQSLFLLTTIVTYGGFIFFYGFFDRYLVFFIPVVGAFILRITYKMGEAPLGKAASSFACLVLLFYGTFAILGTHDFFSFNRVRWAAAKHLVEDQKISPLLIDGGLEFNGWYTYDKSTPQNNRRSELKHGDDYVLALDPIKGYEKIDGFPFRRWLFADQAEVIILKKTKIEKLPTPAVHPPGNP